MEKLANAIEKSVTTKKSICPICNGEMSYRFSASCDHFKPKTKQEYKVYWCPECDHGQIWERPSKEEVAEFYNFEGYYTHKAENEKKGTETSFFDKLRLHLAWRLDNSDGYCRDNVEEFVQGKNLEICEIGCGNGQNLIKFQNKGFTVWGIEPDADARELALESLTNIFDGTVDNLPQAITDRKFDIVLMSHVLEHFLDINAAIINAKNLLKEDGILIIEVPNCKAIGFDTYLEEWPMSDIPRHLNFFTPESLKKVVTQHNLEIIDEKYLHYFRQFSNQFLRQEEKIWSALNQHNDAKRNQPNFQQRAWKFLLQSFYLPEERKCDSIKIIAKP